MLKWSFVVFLATTKDHFFPLLSPYYPPTFALAIRNTDCGFFNSESKY